jgi:hypothetical protein
MTGIDQIAQLCDAIERSGERMESCSRTEVEALQALTSMTLPAVYLFFLERCGRGAGRWMLGSDCFYPALRSLNKCASELLMENGLETLPPDVFVFWMHQGYQFAYFEMDGSEDPVVHYFTESNLAAGMKLKTSLTEFFTTQAMMDGLIAETGDL